MTEGACIACSVIRTTVLLMATYFALPSFSFFFKGTKLLQKVAINRAEEAFLFS